MNLTGKEKSTSCYGEQVVLTTMLIKPVQKIKSIYGTRPKIGYTEHQLEEEINLLSP